MSGINRQKYHDLRLEEYGISREESLGMHIIDENDLAIEKIESNSLTILIPENATKNDLDHEISVNSYLNQ